MVFNEVTYPNLTRLFRELGVAVKPTNMSFSVQHLPTGLEFCGSSLNHLFGQRQNLFRPRFWKMILQINRFNSEAMEALAAPKYQDHTLGEYVRERNYGDDFLEFLSRADEFRRLVHAAGVDAGISRRRTAPFFSQSRFSRPAHTASVAHGRQWRQSLRRKNHRAVPRKN